MKQLFLIIILALSLNSTHSQNYDFGKVSKAELQEKSHPLDGTSSAAILYRNEDISFVFSENVGFIQQRYVRMRVKIYDRGGLDWANKKIYLYTGNSGISERVKGLKGFTYNLDENKVKKDKLKGDAIFVEKASESYNVKSFILPNVNAGSVIEYEYTVTTESPFIDDLDLQFSIPINKLDVKIASPQFYSYNKILNPKASFIPQMNESTKNKRITTSTRKRSDIKVGNGGSFNSSSYDMSNSDYKENILFFNETNIPALKSESYSSSLNNYKAILGMEFAAALDANNVVRKSFSRTWEKVSKTIYDNNNFGGQLNKTSFFKSDVEALTIDVDNDFQKVFLIENLVKSKVKWNGIYGKYAQKGIRNAYIEGEGNVADINLLMVAILRSQGLNANPVLISTRNNGFPLFPSREGFNYVICMVQSGEQYMLIDATEPYSTNNVLPIRVINWKGRVFNDDGTSRWVNLQPKKKSVESTMLNATISNDLSTKGTVRQNITSYAALNYRKKYNGVAINDHIKSLEKDKGDIEISELNFENGKEINQPVKINYEYELSDGIDEVGDKLYLSPLLFLATKENPFKLEERQYPIDFIIPNKDRYLVNIMLPDGYRIEFMPKSEALAFKDSNIEFTYSISQNGNSLQLKVELDINNPIVQPSDYKDFKAFFSKIIEKQAEQVVLTKA